MAKEYSFAIPLIVGSSQFMHQFDGSVIATALPSMAHTMGEDPVRLNLAISSYLLALAVFVPISGWMADRFGARRIFMLAIVVFTGASVLCGLSQSLPAIVLSRILQGIGGAMMTPVARVIVAKTAPRDQLIKAMQYVALPGALAPVLGPSVGGFIVTYFSWQWIFYMNAPIGILGLYLVHRYVPDLPREERAPLDFKGFLIAAVALASLIFGFETIGRGLVPLWAEIGLLIVGALLCVVYVLHARRASDPIIDLRLLAKRTFAAAITGGALFYVTTSAVVFLLAILLQSGFGMSAAHAGLVLLSVAAGSLAARFVLRPLLKWLGFRGLLIAIAAAWTIFLFLCSFFTAETPLVVLLTILFIGGGLARSLMYGSLQSLSYAEMPKPMMSKATSFFALSQQFSQSLGVGLTALAAHVSADLQGHAEAGVSDLRWGFWILALSSALSVVVFIRLPAGVGASFSGGRERE